MGAVPPQKMRRKIRYLVEVAQISAHVTFYSFSAIIAFLLLTQKKFVRSHVSSRNAQIRFTCHPRIVDPQYGNCFMVTF
jgi:hypothetical protein